MIKAIKKLLLTLGFLSASVVVFTSFNITPPTKTDYDNSQYKPVADFGWITEIYMLSQCLTLEHWEKTPGKSFDSIGVSLTEKKYHPVNLFQYGIMCYDLYKRTGNADYKKKCIAQFAYFNDSTRYTTFPDCSIGYPYHINFRDLKPVWYSGLAQAEGILYLIRYYSLTKDEKAIPLIKNSCLMMLKDTVDKGCVTRNDSGEVWIEEYVTSKQKKNVINGFVTSIMGLREYCMMFPDDKFAADMLKRCIATHKKRLMYYDQVDGILYDQGEKQKVGPWYMKFQVIQMKQMYDLFGDMFYKDVEKLWSTYAYNKTIPGMHGCLLVDTNYSTPPVKDEQGWLNPILGSKKSIAEVVVKNVVFCDSIIKNGAKSLFDKSAGTFIPIQPSDKSKELNLTFEFKEEIETDNIVIESRTDSLDYKRLRIYFKVSEGGKWKELEINNFEKNKLVHSFSFDKRKMMTLKFVFSENQKWKNISINNLYINYGGYISSLSHYQSEVFEVAQPKNKFYYERESTNDCIVLCRTADDKAKLQKSSWGLMNPIRETKFELTTMKFLQFLTIFKNNSPDTKVTAIKKAEN